MTSLTPYPDEDRDFYDDDDYCDLTGDFDVEIDEPTDDADEYLSTKDIDEIVDSILLDLLIDEDGLTAAGYDLLAEMDAEGNFV
jgi:hypothetical protein